MFPRLTVFPLLVLLLPGGEAAVCAEEKIASVAVFPVENLSGRRAPAADVRQFLIRRLTSAGVQVLGLDALDAFMTRHRVRYAAGLDTDTADRLREETGVEGVVFASVELSSTAIPPKVALMARLVSIRGTPAVAWADDIGMAGNDSPGLLELGIVNDYQELLSRALERLGGSLLTYLETGETRKGLKRASRFRPRSSYRSVEVEPGRTYTVAVLPFFNLSPRRGAGELLALLFMRHLSGFPQFRVVDAGVVRRQLLDARIIMDSGISISDAETVAALIDADFVLAGRVIRYQDYEGDNGRARVEFSTVLIERNSRRVVWSSDSYNDGDDGTRFFERGLSRTAHVMATQMVRLATEMIAGADQ
jgi:hypothetical protein